jgi:hypothetical protein
MLINSKKFDIRIYVVICGVEKVQAYLYNEGIARFCTVSIADDLTGFRINTRNLT